jgi:hypothetical protein
VLGKGGTVPQRLKPDLFWSVNGTAEAVPLQSRLPTEAEARSFPGSFGTTEQLAGKGLGKRGTVPQRLKPDLFWSVNGTAEDVPLQSRHPTGAEARSFPGSFGTTEVVP